MANAEGNTDFFRFNLTPSHLVRDRSTETESENVMEDIKKEEGPESVGREEEEWEYNFHTRLWVCTVPKTLSDSLTSPKPPALFLMAGKTWQKKKKEQSL